MSTRTVKNLALAVVVAATAACANEPAKPAETPAPAPVAAPAPAAAAPDADIRGHADKKFKAADANTDGMLDEAELREEAKKMRGASAPAGGDEALFQQARSLIMPADTDKDGKISHQEYMAWSTIEDPK